MDDQQSRQGFGGEQAVVKKKKGISLAIIN